MAERDRKCRFRAGAGFRAGAIGGAAARPISSPMRLKTLTPRTLLRLSRQVTRKLWVRVVLMGLLAFVVLGIAPFVRTILPEELGLKLDGSSADRLLGIIANAMLAVTTFSLTVMVTVYRASSQQWTPRVHRLIIEDRTTQNVLAVFIGAYVYALTAIVLRELDVFTDQSAVVLFFMTAVVIAGIVIYLIRWTLHLQTLGSLIATARHLERATQESFEDRLRNPCLGANALQGDLPEGLRAIPAHRTGYVQVLYPEALQQAAEAHGLEVFFDLAIGTFVFEGEALAHVRDCGAARPKEAKHESFEQALAVNLVISDVRNYDQDPRFGLITMSEVASRALSPGINDPGTAIDMVTRIARVLTYYEDEVSKERESEVLDRLHVRPLDPMDLMEDGFYALARDAEHLFEVQLRLQRALCGLMNQGDRGLSAAAREAAVVVTRRALAGLSFPRDRERLRQAVPPEILRAAEAGEEEA
jgi:uncharacterized membrane protein